MLNLPKGVAQVLWPQAKFSQHFPSPAQSPSWWHILGRQLGL